jgi:hypothetical protein
MQANITSVKNPKWANAEHTLIDCEITVDIYENEVLPFTASPNDTEQHGRIIYQKIVDGEYGEIGEYIAPPVIEQQQPTKEELQQQLLNIQAQLNGLV